MVKKQAKKLFNYEQHLTDLINVFSFTYCLNSYKIFHPNWNIEYFKFITKKVPVFSFIPDLYRLLSSFIFLLEKILCQETKAFENFLLSLCRNIPKLL